jgi:hypothetical protein
MPDDDNNDDRSFLKALLRGLGMILTVMFVIVVVAFGLLAGFCGLFPR